MSWKKTSGGQANKLGNSSMCFFYLSLSEDVIVNVNSKSQSLADDFIIDYRAAIKVHMSYFK